MVESTMTWGEAAWVLFLFLLVFSFIMVFIDAARDQSRREKEREESRKWQLKGEEAADMIRADDPVLNGWRAYL